MCELCNVGPFGINESTRRCGTIFCESTIDDSYFEAMSCSEHSTPNASGAAINRNDWQITIRKIVLHVLSPIPVAALS